MLAFDSFGFSLFSVKVSINRFSVDVIIGKRSVHLRQRQVIDLLDYFLRSGPELVPHNDAPNGDAGTRDLRAPAVNPRRLSYESSDVNQGRLKRTSKISPVQNYRKTRRA